MEPINISPLQALERAVALAGGQVALAAKLGVKQGHVWWWLKKSKKAPAEKCADIEAVLDGQVTCGQLRPDVFRVRAASAAPPAQAEDVAA